MDGQTLLYLHRQALEEDSSSSFLDDYTSYYYLWEAAIELAKRTHVLTATQSITTVADTSSYTLNADYLSLYMRTGNGRYYVKYTDSSSNDTFLYDKPYEWIYYQNNSDSVLVPSFFAINDDTLDSQVTGTATSTAASSGGLATLTDTAGDFSDVSAGDSIHNTTDSSDGIVISKTSPTVLVAALFNGTNNYFTSSDAYVIQPQGRMKLVLDSPTETASETITVEYIQRPAPVFSSYGVYRFQSHHSQALVKYAAWLYKYRDSAPDFGDSFYKYWVQHLATAASQINHSKNKRGFHVNLRKRNDLSY